MNYSTTWFLYESERALVRDFQCAAPRAHRGRETEAPYDHLLFTRRGVFAKHVGGLRERVITAEPTHVLLYNKGETFHTSHPADHGDAGTVIGFGPSVLRDVGQSLFMPGWDGAVPRFPRSHVLASPGTLLRVLRLRARLRSRVTTSLEVEEELLRTLAEVVRDASAGLHPRSSALSEHKRRYRLELVEAVKQLLAASPEQPASLPELAQRFATTPYQLTRLFREETGLPLHRYHLRLRVTAALHRLMESDATLSAIGLDLGFASHSHFTSVFRGVFGLTPSQARERRRRG